MQNKEKLVIDLDTAISLYPTAPKELKTILESTFGIAKLSPNLRDRIKTWEDVCKEDIIVLTMKDFEYLPHFQAERAFNTYRAETIIWLFNKGWKPDFTNRNQIKYRMWFERKSSGWFLSVVSFYYFSSYMGSGFYLEKEENARYIGTQFIDIFSKILE